MELTDLAIKFLQDILKPYKYTSVQEIQDSDIENQLEKYSKLSVVCASNVFVNMCMLKIDIVKYICEHIKFEYDKYMTKPPHVTVVEESTEDSIDEHPKEDYDYEPVEKPLELKKEE